MLSIRGLNPQEKVQTLEGVHLGEKQLTDLQFEMYHNHLPRLEEYGYVNWDQEKHIVTKGPKFDEIRPILKLFEENTDELPVDWPSISFLVTELANRTIQIGVESSTIVSEVLSISRVFLCNEIADNL